MTKPNFLIIMSDEHDPEISSPYGHPFVRTPSMQRFAESAALFENAYCNSPLCVPSRASFMTGKHLHRVQVWDNSVPLASDEPTWAHRMNNAGYETCLAGKMHFVGPDQMHGFTRRIVPDIHGMGGGGLNLPIWGTATSRDMSVRLSEEPGPGEHPHMDYDDEVVSKSVTYLSEPARHEQPWVLCSSVFTPHFPFTVRDEFYYHYHPEQADLPNIPEGHLENLHPQSKRLRRHFTTENISEEQIRKARAAYYGLVEFCDTRVGALLDALEANGLAENTIVVYLADHGELNGEHGMWYKCSFYEQSSRIPLIIRWPGVTEAGSRFETITSLLDLVRTMLDIAEAEGEGTDGASLAPLLRGEVEDGGGIALCEYEAHGTDRPGRMVRRGQYKLNYYLGEPVELFDLEADPGEFNDLAADPGHAEVVRELTEIVLTDWDPEAIDEHVRRTQKERQLIAAANNGKPWSPPWRNGKYG